MIHNPSGEPIKYLKGVETQQGFEEVSEEEIIKGYEHTKGHHVLINPKEIDALKLEAKHTIDMARFVDLDQIDSRISRSPITFCRMTRQELIDIAVKEGFFSDAESATQGMHPMLTSLVRSELIRELPDGAFAPPTMSQAIKLRRVG